jgi:hypothetical protein
MLVSRVHLGLKTEISEAVEQHKTDILKHVDQQLAQQKTEILKHLDQRLDQQLAQQTEILAALKELKA